MAVYRFFEIPAGVPEDPALRYDAGNTRVGVEIQLNTRNINLAERLDLLDGRRIYRVPEREAVKLPKDSTGYYLLDTEDPEGPKLRAVDTDPSFGLAVLHDWVNIRS